MARAVRHPLIRARIEALLCLPAPHLDEFIEQGETKLVYASARRAVQTTAREMVEEFVRRAERQHDEDMLRGAQRLLAELPESTVTYRDLGLGARGALGVHVFGNGSGDLVLPPIAARPSPPFDLLLMETGTEDPEEAHRLLQQWWEPRRRDDE